MNRRRLAAATALGAAVVVAFSGCSFCCKYPPTPPYFSEQGADWQQYPVISSRLTLAGGLKGDFEGARVIGSPYQFEGHCGYDLGTNTFETLLLIPHDHPRYALHFFGADNGTATLTRVYFDITTWHSVPLTTYSSLRNGDASAHLTSDLRTLTFAGTLNDSRGHAVVAKGALTCDRPMNYQGLAQPIGGRLRITGGLDATLTSAYQENRGEDFYATQPETYPFCWQHHKGYGTSWWEMDAKFGALSHPYMVTLKVPSDSTPPYAARWSQARLSLFAVQFMTRPDFIAESHSIVSFRATIANPYTKKAWQVAGYLSCWPADAQFETRSGKTVNTSELVATLFGRSLDE